MHMVLGQKCFSGFNSEAGKSRLLLHIYTKFWDIHFYLMIWVFRIRSARAGEMAQQAWEPEFRFPESMLKAGHDVGSVTPVLEVWGRDRTPVAASLAPGLVRDSLRRDSLRRISCRVTSPALWSAVGRQPRTVTLWGLPWLKRTVKSEACQ